MELGENAHLNGHLRYALPCPWLPCQEVPLCSQLGASCRGGRGLQRPVVSRQGQCAWQPGRAFCVGRGRLCMAESRGDGHRPLPCRSGSLPTPWGPWRLLTWHCDSSTHRRCPPQPRHRRGSTARPSAPGRLSRRSLRKRRRPGWPRAPPSSPGPAPPRQSHHPPQRRHPRATPQEMRNYCSTVTTRLVTLKRQVGRFGATGAEPTRCPPGVEWGPSSAF